MPDSPGLNLPPRLEMAGVVPPFFAERVLNALPVHLAVLDSEGAILATNAPWNQFVTSDVWSTSGLGIGKNYLQVCANATSRGAEEAHEAARGIRAVLSGDTDFFSLEYATRNDSGLRWFQMMVTPLYDEALPGAVVVHSDITARRKTEEAHLANQSRLRLLASLASEIVSHVSIEEIIAGTIRRLREYFPEYQVTYAVIDADDQMEITHSQEPADVFPLKGYCVDLRLWPYYLSPLQQQQIVSLSDVAKDPRTAALSERLLVKGIHAMLDVPLRHPEAQFGLLSLNAPLLHVWNDHEITTMQEVAQYLAFAIWNAHMQQEHLRAEAALRFSNTRLNLIARVTGAVVGAVPVEEQARELAELARQAFEVDGCIIRTLEGDQLTLLACDGIPDEELKPILPADFGIAAELLSCLHPITISDVRTHPVTQSIVDKLPHGYHFASYAGAPLLSEDRAIGILGIYSRYRHREFTDTDLEHLQIVANHIAIAIENNRLYREVERQKEQFLQAQKMESIGRLAGGIAHDFNNLLTAVLGYAELSAEALTPGDPIGLYIEQIKRAGERAADLTRQLLAFARKQMIQPRPVHLSTLAQNMEKILRPIIGEDVELVIREGEELWLAKADPGQCEQVILNLAVNARDAMPSGGTLIIETANVTLEPAYVQQHIQVAPGPYVLLAVSDTGIGMTPETQEHIFEPFFTTKEVGKGTGLGLATCYGIVTQAGGHIAVYSELGHGTTFRIYLPRYESAEAPVVEPVVAPPVRGGHETILLVEDEEQLREMAATALEGMGYIVLPAAHGMQALEIAAALKEPLHLLVTDVVMPHMSGREVAQKLTQMCPDLRVLYMSGYTENAIFYHQGLMEGEAFLPKPFRPVELARKIRQILDGTPGNEQGRK